MSSATPPQQTRDEDTQPHGPLSGPEGCPPSTHRLKSDHARLTDSSIPQRPLRTLLLPCSKLAKVEPHEHSEVPAKPQRNVSETSARPIWSGPFHWPSDGAGNHSKTPSGMPKPAATLEIQGLHEAGYWESQIQASLLKSSSEGNPLRALESSLPVEIHPTDTAC